ncbi:hypothetical protein FRC10_002742 [Ceratobasidium sp. 414]|nr:hypothetical protein FRC10_002742 [Ceratobasidium sp. 414]
MEALHEPRFAYRQPEPGMCYSSDSDLEPPHLSETPNETENDTPPETPLRSSILMDDFQFSKFYGIKDSSTTCGSLVNKPIVLPVHIAEPLIVANPHPIRPSLQSFRTLTLADRHAPQERDGGYDSECEGHHATVRPTLPRFRSHRRSPEGMISSSPLTTPKLGAGLGTEEFWNNGGGSPISRRPRHPPPMDIPSALVNERRDVGTQTDPIRKDFMLASLGDLFADPNLDHAALWRGLVSTGVPFRVQKDRKNEATALGHGWPSSLAEDTSRIPTIVPKYAAGLLPAWLDSGRAVDLFPVLNSNLNVNARVVSPLSVKVPVIRPVEFSDEDEMSPIALPESVLSLKDKLFLDITRAGDYFEARPANSSAGIAGQSEHE